MAACLGTGAEQCVRVTEHRRLPSLLNPHNPVFAPPRLTARNHSCAFFADGRLAMIGIAGMVVQELVTGAKLF